MDSAICSVQRNAGTLHAILNQVLAGTFDWGTRNRPTVGEVFCQCRLKNPQFAPIENSPFPPVEISPGAERL
jgi:hypothetical protein